MGWSVEKGVWAGLCPSPEIKKKILVQCVKTFLRSGQRRGASPSAPPPKYATGLNSKNYCEDHCSGVGDND